MYIPPTCSEREPGTWEDCTWCCGVMMYNGAVGRTVRPSTRAEYEALRVAGGDGPAENPGDGSNLQQLQDGMVRRYGWAPSRIGPPGAPHPAWSTVAGHLDRVGDMLVLQGSMGAWDRGSHWRRWDPDFGGPHAVVVIRRDTLPRVWWLNPQAPNDYDGEWMSLSEARRYYDAWIGGAAIARIGQLAALPDTSTEENVDVYSSPGSFSMVWPAGTVVYDGPNGTANRGKTSASRRYLVCGQNKADNPTRYLVDGSGDGGSSRMGWLIKSQGTSKRDETRKAGVAAAAKAAAAAT